MKIAQTFPNNQIWNSSWGLPLTLFTLAFLLNASGAGAAVGGEMNESVTTLHNLLHGNVIRTVMLVGLVVSVVMAVHKSSLVPVGVGVGIGVFYSFAYTWVNATYAVCV